MRAPTRRGGGGGSLERTRLATNLGKCPQAEPTAGSVRTNDRSGGPPLTQSPETRRKTRSWPRAIPECEHPRDWVAVGAVSCEPVSPRFWASARRLLHPRLFPREHKAESSRWLPASQGRRLPGAPDNHVARADADPNTPALCARPSQWDLDTPLAPQVTLTTDGSWSQPRGIHNAVARSPEVIAPARVAFLDGSRIVPDQIFDRPHPPRACPCGRPAPSDARPTATAVGI